MLMNWMRKSQMQSAANPGKGGAAVNLSNRVRQLYVSAYPPVRIRTGRQQKRQHMIRRTGKWDSLALD
jgi:hypothetical protein